MQILGFVSVKENRKCGPLQFCRYRVASGRCNTDGSSAVFAITSYCNPRFSFTKFFATSSPVIFSLAGSHVILSTGE
jgi:hypothetical protein